MKAMHDDGDANEDAQALVLKHPNALMLKQNSGANRGSDGAPAWWGLQMADKNDEEKEIKPIAELKEGRSGIAAGYTHEKI